MLQIVIPNSKEKLGKQIKALNWQIEHDTNEKDRNIHIEALNKLKARLYEGEEKRIE